MNDYTTSAGGWGGGGRARDVLLQIGRVSRRFEFGFLVRGENRVQGAAALVRGSTRVLVSARAARPGLTAAARDDDGLSPRYRPCHRQERGLECWNEWL